MHNNLVGDKKNQWHYSTMFACFLFWTCWTMKWNLQYLSSRVCGPYVVTLLHWTLIFECCMVRFVVKNVGRVPKILVSQRDWAMHSKYGQCTQFNNGHSWEGLWSPNLLEAKMKYLESPMIVYPNSSTYWRKHVPLMMDLTMHMTSL